MKIIPLKRNNGRYSCNPYLVLGDWNRLDDINTVIDPRSVPPLLDLPCRQIPQDIFLVVVKMSDK